MAARSAEPGAYGAGCGRPDGEQRGPAGGSGHRRTPRAGAGGSCNGRRGAPPRLRRRTGTCRPGFLRLSNRQAGSRRQRRQRCRRRSTALAAIARPAGARRGRRGTGRSGGARRARSTEPGCARSCSATSHRPRRPWCAGFGLAGAEGPVRTPAVPEAEMLPPMVRPAARRPRPARLPVGARPRRDRLTEAELPQIVACADLAAVTLARGADELARSGTGDAPACSPGWRPARTPTPPAS